MFIRTGFAILAVATQLTSGLQILTNPKDDVVDLIRGITALLNTGGTQILDLNTTQTINGIVYIPDQAQILPARIGKYSIAVSTDNIAWTTTANGTFVDDPSTKYAGFAAVKARYLKVTTLSETGIQFPWDAPGSFGVLAAPALKSDGSALLGQWGPMIAFPIVPAGAFLLPDGKIVTFSSYRDNEFNNFPDIVLTATHNTYTSTYDPATGNITEADIINTSHDMFCPGMSLDFDGNAVISGGDSSDKTSTYELTTNTWTASKTMNLGRGYQAAVTVSDGRIFTIGGSWSGGMGNKNGEIYDVKANTWTNLSGCPVSPMLTADAQGIYRQDNHGWFFAWKNGYVLQAGPSRAMNWYGTTGVGAQASAGLRGDAADAMNGDAVMYDVGKIFTVGGAPSYQQSNATNAAYHIELTESLSLPTVTKIAPMNFKRSFANSVVLPNGKVFITGGQPYAVPFTDTDAVFTPELWDPETQNYTILPPHTAPRNYHSIALLMQDGRIFTGGGGLCGNYCNTNHEDAQIFSPGYLFTACGELATRPNITAISETSVPVGGSLEVTTDIEVTSFSIIRYGSATHTVNTDQRRIPLTPSATSGTTYTLTLPSDSGIVVPGYWMLFVLDKDGVPSISKNLKVTL